MPSFSVLDFSVVVVVASYTDTTLRAFIAKRERIWDFYKQISLLNYG